MPCQAAQVLLPIITLVTRLVTVGTQNHQGATHQVYPIAASIVNGEELPGGLQEEDAYAIGPEDTPDPRDQQQPLGVKTGASIAPPGTPSVQTINISAVLVTWSYTPNLLSPIFFYVQCSIDGDPFTNVSGPIPLGEGTPNYVYRGMRYQAFYQFQVVASYNGESSQPSGSSNAFINGVTAPSGPPTDITPTKVTSQEVYLVWKRPAYPMFASFIYVLYWGTARNDLEQSEILSDVTSTTISNLHPNTTYLFGLVAMLSGFPSVLSEVKSATTSLPPLEKVSIVELRPSQSWIWLQWTPPPSSPYPADQYTVLYSDGMGLQRQIMVPGQVQNVAVAGLDPGMTYELRVGYTAGGFTGPLSEPSWVFTLQGPHCTLCQPLSSSTLLIEWENPTVVNETLTISEVVGNLTKTLVTTPVKGNGSYVLEGFLPFTQHQLLVALSSSLSRCPLEGCRTIQEAPSGPPIGISIATTNWSSVELMWDPPLPINQNGIITGYVVEVFQVTGGTAAMDVSVPTSLVTTGHVQTLNVSQLRVQVTALQPLNSYSFVVAAGTVVGFGPSSDPVLVTAQQLAAYLEVDVGMQINTRGGVAASPCYIVLVSWNRGVTFPAGVVAPQTLRILGYLLSYSDDAGENGTIGVGGDTTEVQLRSDVLRPGATYTLMLSVEGLYDGVRLGLAAVPVNTTYPDCSGSQVQAWMIAIASLIGILSVVTVVAIPTTIYCWAKHHWKRISLTHSYLMDDHVCADDPPPNDTDQRIVVGGPSEASPSTPDNTSVASDDELAEPLLGRDLPHSLSGLTGESSAYDGLNVEGGYHMDNILMGTRYAPEGCSSSSSNSSTSISDIASN